MIRTIARPPSAYRIRLALIALLLTLCLGTGGFMLIERWSFLDALFMTVITLSTIGYEEVRPLGAGGKVFAIALIVMGVSAAAYAASTIFETFIEQQFFGEIVRGRQIMRDIERLREHYIICGYGRVGMHVAHALAEAHKPFVVVEQRNEFAVACRDEGYLVIVGDATRDAVLQQAGVGRAKGIVTALDTDSANLFITLSCRALNPDLYIVARVSDDDVGPKFIRAGADRVLSPYSLTGRRLAGMVSEPNVVDVVDMIVAPDFAGLAMEEVTITARSAFAGRTLGDPTIRERTGATIIALKHDGTIIANPPPTSEIRADDTVIVFGTHEQLHRFVTIAGNRPVEQQGEQ